MSEENLRTISQVVAELQGDFPEVSVSKVRFLESQGLVTPHRTQSGYRKFGEEDMSRLRWVLEQQRANFLPLRVIRERMEAGDWRNSDDDWLQEIQPDLDLAEKAQSLTQGSDEAVSLTLNQLSKASGVGLKNLREMQRYKLIEPKVTADMDLYDEHDLQIAKAAKGLLDLGLKPRHLRSIKQAVDREIDLLSPSLQQILGQGGTDASRQARKLMGLFSATTARLREGLVRRKLQDLF